VNNSSAFGHDARKGCALWRKANSEAVVTACPPTPSVPILQQRNRHSPYKPSPSSSISENHESHRGKLALRNKPSAHDAVVPARSSLQRQSASSASISRRRQRLCIPKILSTPRSPLPGTRGHT